ncbi:MAG TPA: hypothetical protein VFA97_04900 [Gaiellaceae bacterium]|nr:hypothetical protein [Gaiellaceae bacterium]
MRKLVALAMLVSMLGLVSGAVAGVKAKQPPPFPQLAGTWSHAEINVTIKKVQHTLILDRGRIIKVAPDSITLRAPDGTITQIPLTPTTIIMFRRVQVTTFALRRGLFAETMRIDGGAAVRVKLTLRP